ncbi:glycerophosphodiester phosphodiesterase family protein, partial [[Clostridium] dakarense]|uniref:glycerophosphodiester phosphodiesterase family protein n=1 Tax=Faecalimicrobium dakarense TaxID=1301100 RepID=UPI0004B66FEB
MSVLAPENTLSVFELCKKNGIKWFECDIDILKYKTIVISHDETLDRCTDKTGSLYNLYKEDLEKIDAGSWFSDEYEGEKIPTLDELIELINKYKLNVNFELKSCCGEKDLTEALIKRFVEAINKLDKDREIIVSSFNPLMLSKFKDIRPDVPVFCL